MPLGGFATSRSPLAAVAARGAVDKTNDDVDGGVGVILKLQCLCVLSLLLRATDTLSLTIRDLETLYYSPLRGNILGRTSLSGSARALYRALVRPEGSAFFSEYGEPSKLCQSKSATTSSARFISTSDADTPPQKCVKARSRLLSSKLSEDLPLWA